MAHTNYPLYNARLSSIFCLGTTDTLFKTTIHHTLIYSTVIICRAVISAGNTAVSDRGYLGG